MKLLLDMHTFIWWATEPGKLSSDASATCQDPAHTLFLSIASIWEMQIKLQLGKLVLPQPLPLLIEHQRQANSMQLLSIDPDHIYTLGTLPMYHKDPFDRLVIAQAHSQRLTIVTADPLFATYGVSILW